VAPRKKKNLKSAEPKNKYSFDLTKELILILLRMTYMACFFTVSFVAFIIKEVPQIFIPHQGEVIYMAKHFRKKHKPKVFLIKINFFKGLKLGAKIKILFIFVFLILISGVAIWYFIFKDLPSPAQLTNRKVDVSTKIYDRNGILLYQIYKDQNRTPVTISEIPETVKDATLAGEDAAFYREHGFSLKGILRALLADLTNKDFGAGGSTITQQLVKNTLLTNEKTIIRKIKELVLSIQVENAFSKDKILEMYLNEVSYGGSAYGIEAASQMYFGKKVSELDLAEASLLAGLPKSPTTYSPYGANPDLAIQRQKEILRLMVQNGFITTDQESQAESEKLSFANGEIQIKAPHFVMYVRQKLVDQFGEEEVQAGGLKVTTTLDYNIQQMAQNVVKSQVEKLKGLHVTNGAAVVLDPSTGEILAMVGSTDYFDTANDGNVNVTTALRPPGSSIKVVNYAYALSHGYTPGTIILDAPISFKFPGYPTYTPVNYDGKFVGNITLRNALAESRNIPAVKVLNSYGVDNMIKMGEAMGITTWTEQNTYGLSLTLGGGATRLIDMSRVFATIADYGSRPPIVSIKSVTDYKGNTLPVDCDTNECDKSQVLDSRVAYQLIDILKDNNARAPEFGINSSLVVDGHPEVAVKTGTSNDLRDNLTIGFNQNYLTAVWVGNNDNSPMSHIASGITGAAPIWNEIMTKLFSQAPSSNQWVIPDGLKQSSCRGKNEFFLNETDPKSICEIREGTPSGQIVHDKDHKNE
jgi:penicillin-binding protein 1C